MKKPGGPQDGYFLVDTAAAVILALVILAGVSGFLISLSDSLYRTGKRAGNLLVRENIIYGNTYEDAE